MNIKRIALLILSILALIVSIFWWLDKQGQDYESVLAFITGVFGLIEFFVERKQKDSPVETLDQHNRRVMINHVEKNWVKGYLEKSLYGAALLELGIQEEPSAVSVNYPWSIKKEATDEILPAGKSMLEIFDEVGMDRSLLILGAPGSGKTTMLLVLTRELIERARQDQIEPVPVVFQLASWKEKQTLPDWLAEQLNIEYRVPRKTAATWISENRMSLLLDGLDEVKEGNRAACVDAINEFRKEHGLTSLVICSRTEEYSLLNKKLALEGAIVLQPLTPQQINTYFDRFGKSLARLKQLLRKDKILQELAKTPLMLSVMALAYKDMKANQLLAFDRIGDQREHLFNTYIDRMFERSTRSASAPFTKQETMHSLSWLARAMIGHNINTYQIEAMQPSWLEIVSHRQMYQSFSGLLGGLMSGLMGGLFFGLLGGLGVGLLRGLSVGLRFGLFGGLGVGLLLGPIFGGFFGLASDPSNEIAFVDKLKWSWKTARGGLISWLLWLLVGLLVGLRGGLSEGLISALIFGLLGGLSGGLSGEPVEETTRPGRRLIQSLLNAIFAALLAGLTVGLLFGLLGRGTKGLIAGLSLGLLYGLLGGLDFGGMAFVQHYSLRLVMAQNHFLPLQLIPFLEYCVGLIFLRRVGGSYIFVHRLLMEHFAEMEV